MIQLGILASSQRFGIQLAPATGISDYNGTTGHGITWTLPTPHGLGDLLIPIFGGKPYITYSNNPAGYLPLMSANSGNSSPGIWDAGSVHLDAYHKIDNGSEAATVTSTTAGGASDPTMTAMLAFHKSSGEWHLSCTTTSCETNVINVTGTSQLGYKAEEMVVVIIVHNSDEALPSNPVITIPGCTVGPISQLLSINNSALGRNASMYVYAAQVVSGTASGKPSFSHTVQNNKGYATVTFLRVGTTFNTVMPQIIGDGSYYTGVTINGNNANGTLSVTYTRPLSNSWTYTLTQAADGTMYISSTGGQSNWPATTFSYPASATGTISAGNPIVAIRHWIGTAGFSAGTELQGPWIMNYDLVNPPANVETIRWSANDSYWLRK